MEILNHGDPKTQPSEIRAKGGGTINPPVGAPLTPSRNGGSGSRKNGSNTPGPIKKVRPNGLSDFAVGTRLEAKDFKDKWYPAKIVEVDWEEEEIFIHFEKWSIRFDEWIPMDSSRIRPITKEAEVRHPGKSFSVGDDVMATWTNNCKYPAKVTKTLANDNYEVRFYDGFLKAVRGSKMSKMKEADIQLARQQKEKEQPAVKGERDPRDHSEPKTKPDLEPVPKALSNSRFPHSLSSQSQQARLQAEPPLVTAPLSSHGAVSAAPQPPFSPAAFPPANPLMISQPMVENIGTKEQRKDRKRKLNVAELFTKKRSRLEDKSASPSPTRVRNYDKKMSNPHSPLMGGAGLMGGSVVKLEPGSLSSTSAQNAGPILGTDPLFPADPLKVEGGVLSPAEEIGMPNNSDRKKRKRFKKRKEGASGVDEVHRKSGKLNESEYSVRWADGEPQGEAAYVIDGAEGPRKSIIVDDRRLPEGWSKHAIRRQGGTSAGKWDVFLVSPRDGRKFRSRTELRSYHSERGLKFQVERFDFSLGRKKSYRHKVSSSAKATADVDQGNGSGGENGEVPVLAESPGIPSPSSVPPSQTPGVPPPPHVASGHAQATYGQPPIQRVKTLLPKVRVPATGSPSRKVMSPPPPHSTNPQLVTPHPAIIESPSLPLSTASDGDGFKCPKEGCEKRFRKENLLQMHIKHYHPEYNRFMGSTPNVADLAYARTIGEPLSELPSRNRATGPSFIEKISRFEANRKAAGAAPSPVGPGGPVTPVSGEGVNGTPPEPMSSLEARAPTLNLLLKRGPMRKDNGDGTIAAANAAAAWMVKHIGDQPPPSSPLVNDPNRTPGQSPGLGLSDASSPCDNSKFEDSHVRLGARPSSRPATRPTSPDHSRDESDVSRDIQSSMLADLSFPAHSPSSTSNSPSYFFKKKPHTEKSNMDGPSTFAKLLARGREDRKSTSPIEQLRREELINCTCGYTEEDGLMIQCDLCLCWQHGACNKIEIEDEVPEKYVCQICLHPMRERRSRRFLHDQSWLKDGTLPSFAFIKKNPGDRKQREDLLRRSHDLCGTLLQMQKVIHSLRIKVEIAEQKDHPKLYLWANSWVKEPPPPCPTPPASPVSPNTKSPTMAHLLADGTSLKLEPKQESDSELDKGKSLLQEALLNGSPIQPQHQQLSSGMELLSENIFEQLVKDVEDKLRAPELRIVPPVPQPEAPIHPFECRLKLLDHIEHFQTQLDARLNSMEEQVAALESEDPDVTCNETADFFPQTKQAVQMLLRDLSSVRTFAALS